MDSRIPIACSLEGGEARRRWKAWKRLITQRVETDRSHHQITVTFPGTRATGAELADLVAAERECCGFVTWEIDDRGDFIKLTIQGATDGVEAMAESFGL